MEPWRPLLLESRDSSSKEGGSEVAAVKQGNDSYAGFRVLILPGTPGHWGVPMGSGTLFVLRQILPEASTMLVR